MNGRSTMKTIAARLVALVVFPALLVACSEPTKPVKKLNIKRASDMEPIAAPMETGTDAAKNDPAAPATQSEGGTPLEIIEVQGFRGACDATFVGINDENLVTVRTDTQVRTYRLAGISIPAEIGVDAQNQIRVWLDDARISVEVDDSIPALDAFAYLHICSEGKMVNEELVRMGFAVPSEARYRRSDALKKASVEALTAGRGVWGPRSR